MKVIAKILFEDNQINPLLEGEFKNSMSSYGIYCKETLIMDGEIQRFTSNGKEKNGWYFLCPEGYGYFGDWSKGIKQKFCSNDLEMDYQQQEQVRIKLEQVAASKRMVQIETAEKALLLWDSLAEIGQSNYLAQKQVSAFGIRFGRENEQNIIYIPLRDVDNKLWSLQKILADGSKTFLPGGKKQGCFHLIGKIEEDKPLYIAEGYATAASIHMATSFSGVVAFDAGNIEPVVKSIRNKYPKLEIIIAADNDCWGDQNIGKVKAEAAACKYNCKVILPKFNDTTSKPTDFNDLHVLEGLDKVKEQLISAGQKAIIPYPFILNNKGVYYSFTDKKGDEQHIRLSSPITIEARVCDNNDESHGYLLSWKSTSTGKKHQWCLPARLFAIDKASILAKLLDEGVEVIPGTKWQEKLLEYIQVANPNKLQLCTDRVGWHQDSFVLPDRTYPNSELVLQSESSNFTGYGVKGTLQEWQDNIAKFAQGNSRLILAIACAFAPVLLKITGEETGGIHLVGSSSIGKTTALRVAASVWGSGSDNGYIRQWNTTGNAIELPASSHSDSLLLLDELGQVDCRALENIIYMLSANTGKTRMSKSCILRKTSSWRLLVLSSGEVTIEAKLAEIGKTIQAGVEMRMLNLPAAPDHGHGIFENLHGAHSGSELSQILKDASHKYYGTAIHAFIEKIIASPQNYALAIKNLQTEFTNKVLWESHSGQITRAAKRFALIYAAGILAVEFKILPLEPEELFQGLKQCFEEWIINRGTSNDSEQEKWLAQIKNYFEKYGDSKFITLTSSNTELTSTHKPIDRIGYKQEQDGKYNYYVFPENYKNELCKGFDFRQVTKMLIKGGYLMPDNQGKNQIAKNFPGLGKVRVYHFSPKILNE
jgi:putative DNA primase/helicase